MAKKRVIQGKVRKPKPAGTKTPTKASSAKKKAASKKAAVTKAVASAKKAAPPKKTPIKTTAIAAKKSVVRKPGTTKPATKVRSAKKKAVSKKAAVSKRVASAKKAAPPKKTPLKTKAAPAKKSVARKPLSPRSVETIKDRPLTKKIVEAERLELVAPGVDVGDRITTIVQEWANAPSEPANDAILSILWSNSGDGASFTIGAQDLVRRLNEDLGSRLQPSDINTETMVSDLIRMIV
jgi:hypothetical protein